MLNPWYSTMMLALESSNVITLRMIGMTFGGRSSVDEGRLMLDEKVAASWEAWTTLMGGGNLFGVIDRYREHVAANAARLAPKVGDKPIREVVVSESDIRARAYELWSSGGRTHGHDQQDWFKAASGCSADTAVARVPS